jgi:DNA-binding transcriptional MocR family regulator
MVELDPNADEKEVIAKATTLCVRVYGVRVHRAASTGPPALLLGYRDLDDAAIVEGVKRLAVALA